MKRVLVTGANGFLGGAIRRRLAERGDIDVFAAARTELQDHSAAVATLCRCKPDVVVHAAGRTHGSFEAFHADNVVATETLAKAIVAAAPQCGLVLLGSAAQYGRSLDHIAWGESDPCDPLDDYGTSKLVAEASAFAEATRSGIRVTALRIFNVIASEPQGQQAFASFLRKLAAAMSGPSPWRVEMAPLTAVRDFVALGDVVLAVERAIEGGGWGEAINVCTGVGRPVRALLDDVSRLLAHELPGVIAITERGPPPRLDWSVGDPALCQARLGFTPDNDLSALIRRAADWVKLAGKARANA